MFPLTSFLLYTFVTSITPGPNNIMSMSLGLKVGFKKIALFQCRCPHRVLHHYPSVRLLLRKVKRMDS